MKKIAIALNGLDLLKHVLFKDYQLPEELGMINRTQERILMTIKNTDNLSMVTVARAIGLEKGPFSQTVDKLEELDLIQRIRSIKDKRIIQLQLTEKGKNISLKVENSMEKHFANSINKLSPEELNAFLDALETLKQTANILNSK